MSGPPRWGSETDDGCYLGAAVVVLVLLLGGWAVVPYAQAVLYPTGPDTPLTSYTAATASTNATLVKGAPGNVYHYSLSNSTATIYYLRVYNLAVAPTCSSATGFVTTIQIPASTSGAGRERSQPNGQSLSTASSTAAGIGFCITGGPTSTDNTNAAVGVSVEVLFK